MDPPPAEVGGGRWSIGRVMVRTKARSAELEARRRLLSQIRGPIDLVWDNGTMHRGEAIRDFCRQHGHRLTLHRLPPCAPELNSVEQLNNYIKHGPDCLTNRPMSNVKDLTIAACCILHHAKQHRARLQSLFKACNPARKLPILWAG